MDNTIMANLTTSFGVMLQGMIGIFAVTGAIILCISGLMALQNIKGQKRKK